MARIEIPQNFIGTLGSEMSMDIHWVDVKLNDGRIFKNLTLRSGKYLTGKADDPNGIGNLNFNSNDIQSVKRHRAAPTKMFLFTVALLLIATFIALISRAV